MTRDVILLIDGTLYQASPWPSRMPNPGRNKFLVYRDGIFVATAKTKKEFEEKSRNGWYGACVDAVKEDTRLSRDELAAEAQQVAFGIGGGNA